MQRRWIGLHALLATILLFLVYQNGAFRLFHEAEAASSQDSASQNSPSQNSAETGGERDSIAGPGVLRRREIRLEAGAGTEKQAGEGQQGFRLHFAPAMVAESACGRVLEEAPLALEPSQEIQARWESPHILAVRCLKELPGSTRFRILFAKDFRSLDGRLVPRSMGLRFHTKPLELMQVAVEVSGSRHGSRDALVLHFNQAVDREELKKHLRVLIGKEDATLRISPVLGSEQRAYRVAILAASSKAEEAPIQGRLVLSKGMSARFGALRLASEIQREFRFDVPLRVTQKSADAGGLHLGFSRVPALPRAGTWRIEPAVPLQVVRSGARLSFYGKLPAGKTLALILLKGFPGRGRHRVQEDLRLSFKLPDLRPEAKFGSAGNYISALAVPELPVVLTNVQAPVLELYRAYPNNVAHLLRSPGRRVALRYFSKPKRFPLPVPPRPNEAFAYRIDLGSLLSERPHGIYLARVLTHKGNWWPESRLIQITDLGVSCRVVGNTAAIQVHSLATGRAVDAARVEVISDRNQRLSRGLSREDGSLLLDWPVAYSDRGDAQIVSVQKGEDRCFIDLSSQRAELAGAGLGGRAYSKGLEAWLYAERGIVRPGNEIRITALLRDAKFRVPAGKDFEFALLGPSGKLRKRHRERATGSGMLLFRVPVPGAAPTGQYRVELREAGKKGVLGSTRFSVESFVPERLAVEARFDGALRLGKAASLAIDAKWLAGGPAAQLPYRVWLSFRRSTHRQKGLPGWSFESGKTGADRGDLRVLEGQTNADGKGLVRFTVPGPRHGQTQLAIARVEVLDPSGRAAKAASSAKAYPEEGLLGLRAGRLANGQVNFALRHVALAELLSPKGLAHATLSPKTRGPAAGQEGSGRNEVELRLERCRYEWTRVRRSGGWRWETKTVATVVDSISAQMKGGRLEGRFAKKAPNLQKYREWLRVRASSRFADAVARIGERPAKPDRLRVSIATSANGGQSRAQIDAQEGRSRQSRVKPGALVDLQIESPRDGNAFVTLEGTRVLAMRTARLKKGHNSISVEVPKDTTLPNLHAIVTLTSGQLRKDEHQRKPDPGPHWLIGGCAVPLLHEKRKLDVALHMPKELRPESELELTVDAPGARSVCVALVDEGILRITGHRNPDPLSWFHAARRLAGRGADTGTDLLDSVRFSPRALTGGGGGVLTEFLRDAVGASAIRTVAMFEGPLPLDASGRRTVRFQLPPYEGRLRAIAIAAAPTGVGAAAAALPVRAALGLAIGMPRFLAPSDRAQLVLSCRNQSDEDGELQLRFTAKDGLVADAGFESTQRFALKKGEARAIVLPLRAGNELGIQKLAIDGVLRLASGTIEKRQIEGRVRVRPTYRYARVEQGFVAGGAQASGMSSAAHASGREQRLVIPGEWLPGTLRLGLEIGSSPELTLKPALQSLLGYPYGCVEQTSSRALALLGCSSLLPQLYPEGGGPQLESFIEAAIDRLFSMQTHSGGLAMWPGGNDAYRFGSFYALDFLLEARAAGYELPENSLSALVGYCRSALRVRNGTRRVSVHEWTYGSSLLGRAGVAVGPDLTTLLDQVQTPEDRARLALALHRSGKKKAAVAILAAPRVKAAEASEGTQRESSGFLRSALRALALEIRARLTLDSADSKLPGLVRELARALREPRLLSTQELGQGLLALGAFYRNRSQTEKPGLCTLHINDRSYRMLPGQRLDLRLQGEERISLRASGLVYGSMQLRGYRLDESKDGGMGIQLRRQFVDLATGEEAKTFVRGRLYRVRVLAELNRWVDNLLLMDRVPAGFEIENPRLSKLSSQGGSRSSRSSRQSRLEIRDDRVLFFRARRSRGKIEESYIVRAVFAGQFRAPALVAEALYDPGKRATARPLRELRIEAR